MSHVPAAEVHVPLRTFPFKVPLQLPCTPAAVLPEYETLLSVPTVPEYDVLPPPHLKSVEQPDCVMTHVSAPQPPLTPQLPAIFAHCPGCGPVPLLPVVVEEQAALRANTASARATERSIGEPPATKRRASSLRSHAFPSGQPAVFESVPRTIP
jgi:hypothetical protein